VEFKKGDKVMSVKANKEVILSAGAVGSAKLLMLSGIGPKEHLEQLKVILIIQNVVFLIGSEYVLVFYRLFIYLYIAIGDRDPIIKKS
jgi:hypothetical protein